ncbi:hypothetical protein ACOME3_008990 [Neoechinorhynchus agilis]
MRAKRMRRSLSVDPSPRAILEAKTIISQIGSGIESHPTCVSVQTEISLLSAGVKRRRESFSDISEEEEKQYWDTTEKAECDFWRFLSEKRRQELENAIEEQERCTGVVEELEEEIKDIRDGIDTALKMIDHIKEGKSESDKEKYEDE